jgi:membrane-bound inhibitor of C-type lysozyme
VDCDVGDIVEVVPAVTASDYHVLAGTAIEDVLYEVEDPTIATVQCLTDKLIITGVSAGTTQLKATRLDQTVVVVPNTEIDGYLLDIMVV